MATLFYTSKQLRAWQHDPYLHRATFNLARRATTHATLKPRIQVTPEINWDKWMYWDASFRSLADHLQLDRSDAAVLVEDVHLVGLKNPDEPACHVERLRTLAAGLPGGLWHDLRGTERGQRARTILELAGSMPATNVHRALWLATRCLFEGYRGDPNLLALAREDATDAVALCAHETVTGIEAYRSLLLLNDARRALEIPGQQSLPLSIPLPSAPSSPPSNIDWTHATNPDPCGCLDGP